MRRAFESRSALGLFNNPTLVASRGSLTGANRTKFTFSAYCGNKRIATDATLLNNSRCLGAFLAQPARFTVFDVAIPLTNEESLFATQTNFLDRGAKIVVFTKVSRRFHGLL